MKQSLPSSPRFSVITPVYNPNRNAFEECVRSVLDQRFWNWEWCLVDDCSTEPWIRKYLQKLARRHPNVKVGFRDSNGGISRASNSAIEMATGEYLAFLDNDDVLHRDALSVVNHEIHRDPTIDFIYTDEDKLDENGNHFSFFHKPDWSPELLLGQNYCNHLSVIRTSLVRQVGGLRPAHDGAQDHDLLLRVTEETERVRHIPKILYHWRVSSTSHAGSTRAKNYTADAKQRTIKEACSRRRIDADIIPLDHGDYRIRRRLADKPLTSVIVPTRGSHGLLWGLDGPLIENFILSSLSRTTYKNVEYVIVYDTGTDTNLLERLSGLSPSVRLVEFSEPFNFSKKCNVGAIHSNGDRLLFVNDDVEVITPEWIERLIAFLQDQSIGAVGPMLLYDNGLVQSAGHTNKGPANIANSISPLHALSVNWPLKMNREVSGVTGACLATRRETFFSMGGFSEIFAENFNDVDFCMKLIASGLRIIWTPDAELHHLEFQTRSRRVNPLEKQLLRRYWGGLVGKDRTDPYFP